MDFDIDTIILNETETPSEKFRNVVSSLCKRDVIVENGGFLFSAVIIDRTFHIGILPYFYEGQRSYHYNISLPSEEYILTGFINSNSTVDIFVKMSKKDLQRGIKDNFLKYLKKSYIIFAKIFTEHGFSEDFVLGELTKNVLQELNLFHKIPQNLIQLSEYQA